MSETGDLQAAIDTAGRSGGGTVRIGPGRHTTGALLLRSNITLEIEAGATLVASTDPADFPPIESRWEGRHQTTHAPLIGGSGLENVAVVGRGTIDGRGAPWWERHRAGTLEHPRPRLISIADSSNVLIEGLSLHDSPAWTIHPVRCDNVTVTKVTIVNPPDSPNTDGINPDSCRYVHISDCHLDVGDDCITLKSGIETERADKRRPCEHITITNCTMAHGHGAVVLGSEMSGDVRDVAIANCVFVGTEVGFRFKSRRGRGGAIENVRASNIVMRDVLLPFSANLFYNAHRAGDPIVADRHARAVDPGTPRVRDLRFSDVSAVDAHYAAAFLDGLPEMPIERVAFRDVTIAMAARAKAGTPRNLDGAGRLHRAGFIARNVRDLALERVAVTGQEGEPFVLSDVS